jgi:hypothetical protein
LSFFGRAVLNDCNYTNYEVSKFNKFICCVVQKGKWRIDIGDFIGSVERKA